MAMNNSNGTDMPHTNGAPQPVKRRVKKSHTNPFATARQPGQSARPNGLPTPSQKQNGAPAASRPAPSKMLPALGSDTVSGFTDPAVVGGGSQYTDYKLVATKKDLLEGLRFHLMHMDDKSVDIRNSSEFAQPAHLHRRDPRFDAQGMIRDDQLDLKDGLNPEEREALKVKNEQRKQERAANLAQIAPTQTARRNVPLKMKTRTVYKADLSVEDKRRIQTNYEEKLPWVLEDFDNKHAFVSENQGPLANRHVAFVLESQPDTKQPRFRLVPVEKVYEFKPKRTAPRIGTIEEAETLMKSRKSLPLFLELQQREQQIKQQRAMKSDSSKLFVGESKTNKYAGRTGDEADWDNDSDGGLFADDEDGDVIRDVKDEDEVAADKKIREDQLKANFFEVKQEQEYDEEEAEELKEEALKKENRGIFKILEKHEHNYNHASDSEYSSSVSFDNVETH